MDCVHGRTGRVRWDSLPDWAADLFDGTGLRLARWTAEGRVEVVKHGPHRTIYRVRLPQRVFYVKHYRPNTIWDVARHLFRASPARREWRKASEIARRGIPTVRPVALQEQLVGRLVGESFFVSEGIPGSCTLGNYVPRLPSPDGPGPGREVRRRLLDGLARFTARLHRAGVLHDDFHPGNVLIRLDGDQPAWNEQTGRPELYLVDVAGVRFSGPMGWSRARGNLAVLKEAWRDRLSRTELLRFWRAYLEERPEMSSPPERVAMAQLESHGRTCYQHRLHRWERRALKNNGDYVSVRAARARVHAVRDLDHRLLERLLDDPDELLWRHLDRPVKLDRGSIIVEADVPLRGGSQHVIFKRYQARRWWKGLLGRLRRGRAVRGWYRGHALQLRRIATARPIVACELRRPWYRCRGYLAMEWIEGSENLHLYGWRLARRPARVRARRAVECAESLGTVVGRMHAQGVRHGDLKGSNLLVAERPGRLDTYLVDVDDVRLGGRLTPSQRADDLARLAASLEAHPWVTRTMRRRFLRAYLRQFPAGTVDWKQFWRDVACRSGRIVARMRRRRQAVL